MTPTKLTREEIARIIEEQAEIGVSGDAPLDYGVSNLEELADAILTALTAAPAGGACGGWWRRWSSAC